MEQGLLSEFSNNMFPRGFATPARCNSFREYYIPNSIEELQNYIKQFNETNCFLTVYSFTQYNQEVRDKSTAIIDVIPFDFDDENNPGNSLEDVRKFLLWANKHQYSIRLQYSGNKGFHIFLDIKPVLLKNPKDALKRFASRLKEAANFQTLDMSVVGDLDRVIRIPNTIHRKTGRYCIPLDVNIIPFLSIADIEFMGRKKSDYIPKRIPTDEVVNNLLLEYDEEIEEEMKQREKENLLKAMSRNNELLPGLRVPVSCKAYPVVVEGVKSGNRDHALVGVIHNAKRNGKSYSEIFEILKVFGAKCDPPLYDKYMEKRLRYHQNKDYSFCTFFINFCKECKTCPHNKSIK